jgi:hypothetical protein
MSIVIDASRWGKHGGSAPASFALAVVLGTAALAVDLAPAAGTPPAAAPASPAAPAARPAAQAAQAASAARPAAASPAARPMDEMLTLAAALDSFRSVALAPDGRRVAWVEGRRGAGGRPSEQTEIFALDLPGGPMRAPRRISAGVGETCAKEPAWSPDGRRLAFLSDRSAHAAPGSACGQLQLWVADLDGGRLAEVTHLRGQLTAPAWSPDGG